MSEIDYAAIAAGIELIKRANRAIERRKYTDKTGAEWFSPEDDYCTPTPQYNGTSGKAKLYATEDGKAYEVNVYSYSGKQLHKVTRKGLDAAFRVGQRLADAA